MPPFEPLLPIAKSARPGIIWPALPTPSAALRLSVLYQLEASQWWPPEVLRAHQFRQLEALLAHAARAVPFYRERLHAAGVRPGKPLTPEVWADIPLLRRADIQNARSETDSRNVPRGHGAVGTIATSGTSGKPLQIRKSAVSQLFWEVITLRDHLWHRRDLAGKLAVLRTLPEGKGTYPKGLRNRSWGRATSAVFPTGPSVALSVRTTAPEQAEWLKREDPDYLLAYPSTLFELARHCAEHGIRLPRLREVRTLSEVVNPEYREICREALGVELTDMYSAQEAGYIALQCPEQEHYHVQAETVFLELLDEAGQPCGPGEIGRVVVTPLHNFATPLIRYVIGDYAEAAAPCPCGRGLPVLARVHGRVRGLLHLPDGRRYWPSIRGSWYQEIPAIRQFQFIQTTLDRIEVKLVTERPLSDLEVARFRELVQRDWDYPFILDLTYHDEIPRGPGGKYEDFRSELPAPSEDDAA